MAGISSKAAGSLENKFKYNKGTELANNELSDGSGLEWYETDFRSYDPQIGRFLQIDAASDLSYEYSPYVYAENNPILYIDPSGLLSTPENPHVLPEVIVTAKRKPSIGNGISQGVFNFLRGFATPPVVTIAKLQYSLYIKHDPVPILNASLPGIGWIDRGQEYYNGNKEVRARVGTEVVLDVLAALLGARVAGMKNPGKVSPGVQAVIEESAVNNSAVRPSGFRKATVRNDWNNAPDGTQPNSKQCSTCSNDVFGNPNLGEKRNGANGWDVDHQPKWKDRNLQGMDRKQQLDEFNKNTRLRCQSCNRSDNQ